VCLPVLHTHCYSQVGAGWITNLNLHGCAPNTAVGGFLQIYCELATILLISCYNLVFMMEIDFMSIVMLVCCNVILLFFVYK